MKGSLPAFDVRNGEIDARVTLSTFAGLENMSRLPMLEHRYPLKERNKGHPLLVEIRLCCLCQTS